MRVMGRGEGGEKTIKRQQLSESKDQDLIRI